MIIPYLNTLIQKFTSNLVVRYFPKGFFPSGNFPRIFSQDATSQGYFPKWQLPKCAITQAATVPSICFNNIYIPLESDWGDLFQ